MKGIIYFLVFHLTNNTKKFTKKQTLNLNTNPWEKNELNREKQKRKIN